MPVQSSIECAGGTIAGGAHEGLSIGPGCGSVDRDPLLVAVGKSVKVASDSTEGAMAIPVSLTDAADRCERQTKAAGAADAAEEAWQRCQRDQTQLRTANQGVLG